MLHFPSRRYPVRILCALLLHSTLVVQYNGAYVPAQSRGKYTRGRACYCVGVWAVITRRLPFLLVLVPLPLAIALIPKDPVEKQLLCHDTV